MPLNVGKKTPFGCQECKRRRIKCSNIRLYSSNIDTVNSIDQKPCRNCIKTSKNSNVELKCVYLNLFEQKELRRIRKILKKKNINNGKSSSYIDNYMIIEKYIRGSEVLDDVDEDSKKNTLKHELSINTLPNMMIEKTVSIEDSLKSNGTKINELAFDTPNVNDFSNNWDFMLDDIMNLMNTIESDTKSIEHDDMHEALEQDIVFNVFEARNYNNKFVNWEQLENFFNNYKQEFKITDKDIIYFKIFYEKISYWISPYQLIEKHNIINNIFFNYILSKNNNNNSNNKTHIKNEPLMCDPLVLGMLALAAKYNETIEKTKSDSSSDSSKYAELAITFLNAKIVHITDTSDNFTLLNECIGSLTITILLLVIYNSSQNGSNWRKHQRGAKNIYLKYLRNKNNNNNNNSVVLSQEEMDLLLLFKQWFPTFDLLASFITLEKGTLTTEEYNLYFKENELNHVNSCFFIKTLENDNSWYNTFQGYGNNLMKLIVKLLDFIVMDKKGNDDDDKDFDFQFFLDILGDINDCRNYYYKKNRYGLLIENENNFNDDQIGIISVDKKKYSIFDMTHSSHTNLVTIVFLQRLNNKNNNFAGLIEKNFEELKKIISFMFKQNFDYKFFFEKDLEELLHNPTEVSIDTFTDKLHFEDLLNRELIGDFKLLMFFSAIQIYATSLTKNKTDYFEERCKVLSYCHSLYLNCGSTGCFTSFKYFIAIWKQFDAQTGTLDRINNKGLYNKSVPFI